MKKLEGKVAVVTGAARGIGAAVAKRLAADGASVVVNYTKSEGSADEVVGAIRRTGGRAIAVRADVGDPVEIKVLFDAAEREFGRVDILVNNAGVGAFGAITDVTAEEYARQHDVNVRGLLLASSEAARRIKNGGGRIINVSSVVTETAPAGGAVYTSTKSAVDGITRALSAELGPRAITVNAVAPGPVETDMYRESGADASRDFMVSRTPLGRIGRPEDIAGPVAFPASEDAGWVTGQVLYVSGGFRF